MSDIDYSVWTTEELLATIKTKQAEADLFGVSEKAKKVLLNSLYGALANNYFRHYRTKDAEAITLSGQYSIRYLGKKLSEFLAKYGVFETEEDISRLTIYSDTDSCYLSVQHIVDKYKDRIPQDKIVDFLDTFVESKLQPQIDAACDEIAEYMNFYQNTMGAKRETIAQSGIWTGKKRYALHVWDVEGVRYDHPKVKVTGIETQKSSTPRVVREALKKALDILLGGTEQELRDYINEFRDQFEKFSVEEIAFPRTVSGVNKYIESTGELKKGTPIHSKAAIVHNRALKDLGVVGVQPISGGDKILYVHLKPSQYRSNVIAFVGKCPKEFNIEPIVDRDLQFEKTFMSPLEILMNAVKWGLEDISTLDEFFM